jgi:hypothetical protein
MHNRPCTTIPSSFSVFRGLTTYERAASDPSADRLFQPAAMDYPDLLTSSPSTSLLATNPLPDAFPQLLASLPPGPLQLVETSATSSTESIQPVDSAQARIAHIRQQLLQWNTDWGPIHQWPRHFEDGFGDAKDDGRSGPWVEEIQVVVEDGRRLVQELQHALNGSLPMEDWMIRDVWRSSLSLMAHLLEGITVLETRLEIVAPFPHEAIWRYAAHRQNDK